MSNVIEFPQIPLWNPYLNSMEFILNKTNFDRFKSDTISSVTTYGINFDFDLSEFLENTQKHIDEYGYVVMEFKGMGDE